MARKRPLTGAKTVSVSMSLDLSAIEDFAQAQREKVESAVWKAASAGARFLYVRTKLRVRQIPKKTGNLMRSIYYAYSPERSRPMLKVYSVSWNHVKAPHGRLVEWGYLQRYQPIFVARAKGKWRAGWYLKRKAHLSGKELPPISRGAKSAQGKERVRRAFDERYELRKKSIRTKAWRFIGRGQADFPEAVDRARRAAFAVLRGADKTAAPVSEGPAL